MADNSRIEWTEAVITRFWSYVEKTDGCWIWRGGTFAGRYGQFRVGAKKMKAHRVSWLLTGQHINDGMILCHRCDNMRCVRPDHLFLGTHGDNAKDREVKGRGARFNLPRLLGEKNPAAKITAHAAREIQERYRAGGITKRALAQHYGISLSQVVNITLGRSWANGR